MEETLFRAGKRKTGRLTLGMRVGVEVLVLGWFEWFAERVGLRVLDAGRRGDAKSCDCPAILAPRGGKSRLRPFPGPWSFTLKPRPRIPAETNYKVPRELIRNTQYPPQENHLTTILPTSSLRQELPRPT